MKLKDSLLQSSRSPAVSQSEVVAMLAACYWRRPGGQLGEQPLAWGLADARADRSRYRGRRGMSDTRVEGLGRRRGVGVEQGAEDRSPELPAAAAPRRLASRRSLRRGG